MKLTLNRIKQIIAKDNRIDQELDVVDDGDDITVAIWTNHGWTWDANDGNRHVEIVRIGEYSPNTVSYLRSCIKYIERDESEAA